MCMVSLGINALRTTYLMTVSVSVIGYQVGYGSLLTLSRAAGGAEPGIGGVLTFLI